jgi:hypothetical protein
MATAGTAPSSVKSPSPLAIANDGTSGEGDNVGTDGENVASGSGSETITGFLQ